MITAHMSATVIRMRLPHAIGSRKNNSSTLDGNVIGIWSRMSKVTDPDVSYLSVR